MSKDIKKIQDIITSYPDKNTKYESITIGVSSKHVIRVYKDEGTYILIDFSKCNNMSDEIFAYPDKNINKTQINYFIDNGNLLRRDMKQSPLILAYDIDKKLVLMDDMGNRTLKKILMIERNQELSGKCFLKAIDIINMIQEVDISNNTYFNERIYDKNSIVGEIKRFINSIIIRDNTLERISDKELNIIDQEIDKLASDINHLPKALIHRDYQSTNVLYSNNQLFVIDFQDMCMGHYIYDLIALLFDLNIYINEKTREKYIHYFWENNKISQKIPYNDFLQMIYKYSQHRLLQSITWRSRNYLSGDMKIYKEVKTGIQYINHVINKSNNSNLLKSIHPYLPTGVISVILGAGKGSRMNSSLKGKPMTEYVIDSAEDIKSDFTYVIIGYKRDLVKETLKGRNVKFVVQEEQLGTGHALAQTLPILQEFQGDIISMVGDAPLIPSKAIKELIEYHQSNNFFATVEE